jgi:uncharacterized tellurite resistance protein B-like protein
MLDAIRRLVTGKGDPAAERPAAETEAQRLHVAACALLLELAHADDEFTDDERGHIEEALVRHFDLTPEAARELMVIAEERRVASTDLYQFTSVIRDNYDEGQRMVLVEILWRVVYADGRLSSHEDYLIHKLASLLDLRPGYLSVARRRATSEPPRE